MPVTCPMSRSRYISRKAHAYAEAAHEGPDPPYGPRLHHPSAGGGKHSGRHAHGSGTIIAGLLHDVLEDTEVGKQGLGEQCFGTSVAEIVDGVSKLENIFRSRAEAQAENFQKMAMAMAKDIRVIMVKLADRLHNMRTIGVMSDEQRKRTARETLDFYAPIANRLGIHSMKVEFEEAGVSRALSAARRSDRARPSTPPGAIARSSWRILKPVHRVGAEAEGISAAEVHSAGKSTSIPSTGR